MRSALVTAVVVASASVWLVGSATAAEPSPPALAQRAKLALSGAQTELILGDRQTAVRQLDKARRALHTLLEGHRREQAAALATVTRARAAAGQGDEASLAVARATVWTAVLRAALAESVGATSRGDVQAAREWLLVREFRPPTRFTRAATDATRALGALGRGALPAAQAAAIVRADLLDVLEGRLRTSLASVREAQRAGFVVRAAESAALAQGYWPALRPVFTAQRGALAARTEDAALAALVSRVLAHGTSTTPLAEAERPLDGFRAVPLGREEALRRAGQLQRFTKLVAIEYGRGVQDGRVTKAFEIQEAITFRDGAAAAFADLESLLLRRDPSATRRIDAALTELSDVLGAVSRGEDVATPGGVSTLADAVLGATGDVYPPAWKDAAKTADFDVIAATLDRLEGAVAGGDWGAAEQARLEAYGVFELGPEQRLRGLAPGLFQRVEELFWYGHGDHDGLVQLIERRAAAEQIAATRAALDEALVSSEERIGSGPGSRLSIVTNSAIIVFREGLEAVLILAALMASLVGAQRRHRRPLLAGVAMALAASVVTWAVAQTVLGSLAGWGEKLSASVGLVAIAVLLLILNWFYHRVYWQENLQGLHRRKKLLLGGAGLGMLSAQALGLVALGFSSVYREGFETVLFLQALTLEAGAWTVLQGVALGFGAVLCVFLLVVALERRLPHKKMLVATGLMITWVLVVLVGQTVQTMQKVGWVPVTPVDGVELPYWAGIWLGVYPTWEGLLAQFAALAFVIGSYIAAETLRSRRRSRLVAGAGAELGAGGPLDERSAPPAASTVAATSSAVWAVETNQRPSG